MATPEYINTLVTKFAAARATRLNLVKQAGMVPPADRASTANSALAGRGYDNASGSHFFRMDPSYNSLLHPTQMFGDSTVDAQDQSWSNPEKAMQNLADYGASAGLGGLLGNQYNKIVNRINFANNGIPINTPIAKLDDKALSAYVQSLAGDGKGSTRFSVGPNPRGFLRQVGAHLTPPNMPSTSTPAMTQLERDVATRAAMATTPLGRGQTAVKAPLEIETVTEAKPAVPSTPSQRERQATYDRNGNQLTPFQPKVTGTPFVAGEQEVVRQVQPKTWANTPASRPSSPIGDQTVHVQSTNPGTNVLGKPKNTTTNESFRPGEYAMSPNNRPSALRHLGWGMAAGVLSNAIKNMNNNNGSPFAATKMPVSFDEAGNPTPATQQRMAEDAANAGR